MCINQKTKTNHQKANDFLKKIRMLGLYDMYEFEFSSAPADHVKLTKYNPENDMQKHMVTIPDFVTEIGDGAFNKCTELEKLILINPEIKIGKFAFAGCAKLSEIHIGGKITDWHTQSAKMQLSEGTFAGCKNLNITNLPPFAGCFERFHLKGLTCYTQVKQTGEEIKLPDINYTLDPSTMESILLYLLYLMLTNDKSSFLTIDTTSPQPELFLEFDNSQNSSEIILKRFKPETQRRKQFKPFNLSELSSEEKEKILDIYSRIKCVSIDKNNSKEEDPEEILKEILIRLNKNLQDIETGIQETLKKIQGTSKINNPSHILPIIPPRITTIENGAYDGWDFIDTLIIPEHVKEIKSGAFFNCKSLFKVIYNPNTTHIQNNAFPHNTTHVTY